jgi:hypothetical protein
MKNKKLYICRQIAEGKKCISILNCEHGKPHEWINPPQKIKDNACFNRNNPCGCISLPFELAIKEVVKNDRIKR